MVPFVPLSITAITKYDHGGHFLIVELNENAEVNVA